MEIFQACGSATASPDYPDVDYECNMDEDSNFEPMQRSRSNTWPMMQPTHSNEADPDVGKPAKPERNPPQNSFTRGVSKTSSMKRRSGRRANAWGNLTYAELITQAIGSSEDKRLTLSQIYEWMMDNFDYFRERRDTGSSAGWKNSIRHNLSLHNRFVRVANDQAGKSSYWTVNPNSSQSVKLRRRATMDPEKMDKFRGRFRRQAAVARTALDGGNRSAGSGESEVVGAGGRNGFSANGLDAVHVAHSSAVFRPQVANCSPSGGTWSAFPTLSYGMQDQTSVDNLKSLPDQSWMQPNPISSDCVGQAGQTFEPSLANYGESNFGDNVCNGQVIIRSCVYHKNQICECNSTIMEIMDSTHLSGLPRSNTSQETVDRNYDFASKNAANQAQVMPASYFSLKPIQETVVTSSVNGEVGEESSVGLRPLTKCSSILDDISEVIGRELIAEKADVNQVESSLSTTLHISQNVLYDDDVESWV